MLQTCTLGKDQYQDFYALDSTGATQRGPADAVPARSGSRTCIAAVTNPASSCLTDPSTLDPATPQSDAADEAVSPAGRQMRTSTAPARWAQPVQSWAS